MNWAHVHLIINHFPVIGILGAILLLVYSLVRKSEEVKMMSLGVFAIIALLTLAVYFTGEAAEKIVKNLPGVTETYIGRHEEIASLTLVLMEILGITSVAGLVLLRRSGAIPKWLAVMILILSLITAVVVNLTANFGGQIRHTEIRDDVGSRAGPASR
ncbi:MAG TPA: hypothetical protein VFG02_02785 [Nitrospirota bacterium]|nr:hypothetical protein [Nitrospirota bacterium]